MKKPILKDEIEKWAEKLHEFYLEATKNLHPESYNPKAQKLYSELTEEQKEIDRYIATRILELVEKEKCPLIPEKYRYIKIGSIWINDQDYEVEVLDLGEHALWLRYLENNQHCSWDYEKFLEQYDPSPKSPRG